mmetsp:Transcript_16548/g.22351  ORF Transcript_16548/g.22351 Transcript_16548/m.22351 type:complete len:108 (+) Transcript_16548:869-1192(+)|eukprot:CAMPEP_0185593910 /NCGR_PEP_ID=MMETSP0434-20130131/73056_1 /TAXON_ID=626734 ORGANISM="Favella taraikaensis, Strain Fe Narragansett Bay" /NCGR_SAMPLE_ID=MMETSP0434 /ASSEMBLY_ACC=CAM_ASM_000379 /LENGTH=107 /DNA_ID=CAMNT_0028220857 /DNA_START=866 /DNA_END=1189 /DNA_ORIENTATION=+
MREVNALCESLEPQANDGYQSQRTQSLTLSSKDRPFLNTQRPAVLKDFENDAFAPVNDLAAADGIDDEADSGEYFLEEFGKLNLNYFPERLSVFSGFSGTTYVLMAV